MATNSDKLKRFLSEDEILDIMIIFKDQRKVEACRQLQNSLLYAWTISITEAMGILQNIDKEL